jgi:SAM-dependent methyltransferase
MKEMKIMDLESIFYPIFGTSTFVGLHIRRQLDLLEQVMPSGFKGRDTHDLGCGDGKITLMLEQILNPSSLRGFDVQPALVRQANSRGLPASVIDLNHEIPRGDLAVLWGVLHHLDDAESILNRTRENYSSLLIREPLKLHIDSWIELGHPMRRRRFIKLIEKVLPGAIINRYGGSMFVFYTKKDAC